MESVYKSIRDACLQHSISFHNNYCTVSAAAADPQSNTYRATKPGPQATDAASMNLHGHFKCTCIKIQLVCRLIYKVKLLPKSSIDQLTAAFIFVPNSIK